LFDLRNTKNVWFAVKLTIDKDAGSPLARLHEHMQPLTKLSLEAQEFLTEETTCTNEMSKETTSENICQKRPRAAWASAGRPLPPLPLPARPFP
jgi:hypothetical protein